LSYPETTQTRTTEDFDRFPKSFGSFPIGFEEERRETETVRTKGEENGGSY
jgi:hypothetical protein